MIAALHRSLLSASLCLAALPAAPPPQRPGPAPQDAFVTTHENGPRGRVRRLFRVPLQAGASAVLLAEGADAPQVLGRISADEVVLVGGGGPPRVVELEEAATRPLFAEDAEVPAHTEWVGSLDGALFGIRRDGPRERAGALVRCIPGEPPEVIHESGVRRVAAVRREGIVYLTDDPPALWTAMHRAGTEREVLRLAHEAEPPGTAGFFYALALELSPSSRRLAVASPWIPVIAGERGEDAKGGSVLVVDTVSGKVLGQRCGIPMAVSPFSSSTPSFEMAWASDRVLRFSRSAGARLQGSLEWVDWDVDRDAIGATHRYPRGLAHRRPDTAPPADAPREGGALVHGGLELRRREGDGVAFDAGADADSATIGTIRTDPSANWAIVQPVGTPDVFRVGATGKPEHVAPGFVVDVVFW